MLLLSPESILALSASFKAGRCKSFLAYVSKSKEMHIRDGYQCHESRALASSKATTSVLWGSEYCAPAPPLTWTRHSGSQVRSLTFHGRRWAGATPSLWVFHPSRGGDRSCLRCYQSRHDQVRCARLPVFKRDP